MLISIKVVKQFAASISQIKLLSRNLFWMILWIPLPLARVQVVFWLAVIVLLVISWSVLRICTLVCVYTLTLLLLMITVL